MMRGRCELADTGRNLLSRIDEVERAYLHGPVDRPGGASSTRG
jgi:hypothetical protein